MTTEIEQQKANAHPAPMTAKEAVVVRAIYRASPGYDETVKEWPKLELAVAALPDETLFRRLNVMIAETLPDAIKHARRYLGH